MPFQINTDISEFIAPFEKQKYLSIILMLPIKVPLYLMPKGTIVLNIFHEPLVFI